MTHEPKTDCRTPAEGRDSVTRIPMWKYDACRAAILKAVAAAGEDGLSFKALADMVRERPSADQQERLGSVGWHVTCVKLNMEVDGELARLPGQGPQRIVLT